MTPQEIEDLQKEVILLRMRNQRLEADIKKLQNVIKDILIGEIKTELADQEAFESAEVENAATTSEHTENPA